MYKRKRKRKSIGVSYQRKPRKKGRIQLSQPAHLGTNEKQTGIDISISIAINHHQQSIIIIIEHFKPPSQP
jgi:hypothetical protein